MKSETYAVESLLIVRTGGRFVSMMRVRLAVTMAHVTDLLQKMMVTLYWFLRIDKLFDIYVRGYIASVKAGYVSHRTGLSIRLARGEPHRRHL